MTQTHVSIGLERALAERGMSQADLSRRTGKSPAQISRWVDGTVPADPNRRLLVRALNEPVEQGEVEGEFFTVARVWGADV